MRVSKVGNSPTTPLSGSTEQKEGMTQWKESLFKRIANIISEDGDINPIIYYGIQVFECLSMLWFVLYPQVNTYSSETLFLQQLRTSTSVIIPVLKHMNFYERLAQEPESYQRLTFVMLGWCFLMTLLAVFIHSITALNEMRTKFIREFKKLSNILYFFNLKFVAVQFTGLSINILYCDTTNPYHQGQQCYTPEYTGFCIVAIFFLLSISIHCFCFTIFYAIRNPFYGGCLGYPNRYDFISKMFIKMFFPLFFALNHRLKLDFIYLPFLVILWGAFIYFHRINSLRSYNYKHFYVEYFCDGFLFCMTVCSLLVSYLKEGTQQQAMSLVYAVVLSLLGANILINIDKNMEQVFLEEGCETKVSKQNVERFFLGLINALLYAPLEERRKNIAIFTRIWKGTGNSKTRAKLLERKKDLKEEQLLKQQVYQFLLELSNEYIKESKSMTLKFMRCQLLKFTRSEFFSLHEALELQSKKLNILDQFSLYLFLGEYKHLTEPDHSEYLVRVYDYHSKVSKLSNLITECAQNNLSYWEQICDESPSVTTLRELATKYVYFSRELSKTFDQLPQIKASNIAPAFEYFRFLRYISADVREAFKVRSILNNHLSNKNVVSDPLLADSVAVIIVDTLSQNLGIIISSNTETTNMLGYERDKLTGKKLTRLMPEVYSQLHNSFIMNYLQKDTAQLQDFQNFSYDQQSKRRNEGKLVTALNAQSFLVQLRLNLHIVASTDNSLYMVGFLRKVQEQSGLAMVEAGTGDILGISNSLSKLMKHSLTGKQVIQETKKIKNILPQFALSTLAKHTSEETLLELDTVSQKGSRRDLSLQVIVTLKDIKHYQGHKLLFLEIKEKTQPQQQIPSLLKFNRRNSRRSAFNTSLNDLNIGHIFEQMKSKQDMFPVQVRRTARKMSVYQQLATEKESDILDDLALTHRMERVATEKQKNSFGLCILVMYFAIFAGCLCYYVFCSWQRYIFLSRSQEVYDVMKMMIRIPYAEAKVSLFADQLQAVYQLNQSPYNASAALISLHQATNELTTDFSNSIMRLTQDEKKRLIHTKKKLPFAMGLMINGSLNQYSFQLTYQDALSVFINDARQLVSEILAKRDKNQDLNYLKSLFMYITGTADRILAVFQQEVSHNYLQGYHELKNRQLQTLLLLLVCAFILAFIGYASVIFVGNTMSQEQSKIYQGFYRKLRMWDANQMLTKAQQFIQKHTHNAKKIRKSKLSIQNFAIEKFVTLFNNEAQSKTGPKVEAIDEQKTYLNSSSSETTIQNSDKTIQLKFKFLNKKMVKYWVKSFSISSTIFSVIFLFLYLQIKAGDKLDYQLQLLGNLGHIRKDLVFMSLYAQKIANNPLNANYSTFTNATAADFYQYSSLTFNELGEDVFKKVYGYVETFQRDFSQHNSSYNATELMSSNHILRQVFMSACQKLSLMIENRFSESFSEIVFQAISLSVFKTSTIMFLLICICSHMYYTFSKPLEEQRVQAINMIRLVPVWMINRSLQAKAFFNK